MISPEMEGVEISRKTAEDLKQEWRGECFMAAGATDPVLGLPVMGRLRGMIRGASELMIVEDGGHFVQEWGEPIARAALEYFRK